MRKGARLALPLFPAVVALGASFGVLARTAHIGALAAVVMSATTFAGSSQVAAVSVLGAGGGAAAAIVAALEVPAGAYNVVEDRPLRRREVAAGIARLEGVPLPRLLPRWAWPLGGATGSLLARSLRISNRKLRAVSDWAPRYLSVLDGLAAVVAPDRDLAGKESG
jgi:hypothetical protein